MHKSLKKFQPRTIKNRLPAGWLKLIGRGLLIAGFLVAGALFSRSSLAEFEIPYISTADNLTNIELRGIWAFNRGTTSISRYEAYAVGVDPSITTCPDGSDAENCNGIFYLYNGQQWSRVNNGLFYPHKRCTNDLNKICTFNSAICGDPANCVLDATADYVFSLNAVGGAGEWGTGNDSKLYIVGSKGRIAEVTDAQNYREYMDYSTIGQQHGQFTPMKLIRTTKYCAAPYSATRCDYNPGICPGGSVNCTVDIKTTLTDKIISLESRAFRAVDAGQTYNVTALAGGDDGLLAVRYSWYTDAWQRVTGLDFTDPTKHYNVTGIKYSNDYTAYVTTSTFTGNQLDYNCEDSQLSQLYKIGNVSGLSKYDIPQSANAQKLITDFDGCIYGLAISTLDNDPINTGVSNIGPGPLQNIIWLATSNGVYKYDENGSVLSGPLGGTGGKRYYSIVAIPDRGGSGQQLLANGGFESWNKTNNYPVSGLNKGNSPSGWLAWEETNPHRSKYLGRNNWDWQTQTEYQGFELGACYDVYGDFGNWFDIRPIPKDIGSAGAYAVMIQPGAGYANRDECVNWANPETNHIAGLIQRIDLTSIEGSKFKISGRYKVEFPNPVDSTGHDPVNPNAYGGVWIGCVGGQDNNYLDCSLTDRSLLKVRDTNKAYDNGTGGWVSFEKIVSRSDSLFNVYPSTITSLGKRRAVLEIRCQASYGAAVGCDDFKVEEVVTPSTESRNRYTVIAAGQDINTNKVVINKDSLNVASAWTNETLPIKVRNDSFASIQTDIRSMVALGKQHVFSAGVGVIGSSYASSNYQGITLFTRPPSTLTGNIWVGASSPGSSSGISAPIGQISASCVNDRVSLSSPTLCQDSPESYGISLDMEINGSNETTGFVSGRAWMGKPSTDLQESMDLGRCIDPPIMADLVNEPFNFLGICNLTTHRCWANSQKTTGTNKSCVNDYQCVGHCEKDAGHWCTSDPDCRRPTPSSIVGVQIPLYFAKSPSYLLQCSPSNPLACTSGGWLSFESNDFADTKKDPPGDDSLLGVTYNTTNPDHNEDYLPDENRGNHELSGWARFMTLASEKDTGWVRFRGVNLTNYAGASLKDSTGTITYGAEALFGCRNCVGSYTNNSYNCAFCQGAENYSCSTSDVATEANCYLVCENGHKADNSAIPCTSNEACQIEAPVGWDMGTGLCRAPGFCTTPNAAGIYEYCTTNDQCASGRCAFGAICSSVDSANGGRAQCAKYGVNLDTESKKFYGNAWSQDYGWLDFSKVTYSGGRILQTRLADIYAGGEIGSATGQVGACNGSYFIISGTNLNNFISCSTTLSLGEDPKKYNTKIPYPTEGNVYQNILGRFDLKGIETDIGSGVNKYGSQIVSAIGFDSTFALLGSASLDGKIYQAPIGDFSINSPIKLNNGITQSSSGAGILVVNGDLTINANIVYETRGIMDLRQLASLTVIVHGDLTIANEVTELAGAYYVTGMLKTSDRIENNQFPLTVNGLLMAKTFEFGRQYGGTVENPLASELIIFDGRLQSNPMPGMVDFASALPNNAKIGP